LYFLFDEADRAKVETAITTVDHSDIRGSSLAARHHGRDPSGAASDLERESGRRACRIGLHEDSPFRVPYRLLPALLHHNHYYESCFMLPVYVDWSCVFVLSQLQWPR
jgi:hypothetical protein